MGGYNTMKQFETEQPKSEFNIDHLIDFKNNPKQAIIVVLVVLVLAYIFWYLVIGFGVGYLIYRHYQKKNENNSNFQK